MGEKERLVQWMQARGFTIESLAAATGDSYSSIYMMLRGGRELSDAFKWRFALAFGWSNVEQVFEPTPLIAPQSAPHKRRTMAARRG